MSEHELVQDKSGHMVEFICVTFLNSVKGNTGLERPLTDAYLPGDLAGKLAWRE